MLTTAEKIRLLNAYEIGNTTIMGGTMFFVQLLVDRDTKKVLGIGRITNTSNPPLNIFTLLAGSYQEYWGNGQELGVGFHLHSVSTPEPLIGHLQAVELWMNLDAQWESGTAAYKYVNVSPPWVEVENVPVKSVNCNADME